MSQPHPLVEGIDAICNRHRGLLERAGLFQEIYNQIRTNWSRRESDRWPTPSNWVLRVAPEFTPDENHRFEKQLQKQIAICLENEGWGNDIPTASGLVNSRARQMNVDLGHRITGGLFELVELKLGSDTPYDAALQILRYGAIYMLYRLEPELATRFRNEMTRAKGIVLEVLAPRGYYSLSDVDLPALEKQLNDEVASFANRSATPVSLSFRFRAFPSDFVYQPGMDCELIRDAVRHRASPFAGGSEPLGVSRLNKEGMRAVEIRGHGERQIDSFTDWAEHALPPDRRALHWKEGRSAFELGRSWTTNGAPTVPLDLFQLLESHEGTKRTVIQSGITEHETTLPFGDRGPRCHDLALRAQRDDCVMTICIEAKADEPFGRSVADEFRKAKERPVTRFPERLDWLTRSLLGIPAFKDDERVVLSDVVSGLSYQLLTAVAGTLIEAQIQGAATAVFLVHEFRTQSTMDAKLEGNAAAMNRFLRLFYSANGGPDEDVELSPGDLIGPISVIERPLEGAPTMPCEIPLFLGKIRTDLLA